MTRYIEKANLLAFISRYGISQEFQEVLSNSHIEDKCKYQNLNISDIKLLCDKINNIKLQEVNRSRQHRSSLWMKGQFKLFIWVSIYYSFTFDISIKQFQKKDFSFLSTIFIGKTVERMMYQLKSMFQTEKLTRKKWENQEIQLLQQILQKYEKNQKKPEWKSIAYELFLRSNGTYLRSFGQCRQMFINHLSKNIKKDNWTEEQDKLLIQLAQIYVKRWSKISQMFRGQRSGHMIKNRYVALMKRRAKILEQIPANQQIKPNSQVKLVQQKQRQDSTNKLPSMIYTKEVQTQSYDNSDVQSIGKQRYSLFFEPISFLEIPKKCQLPFQNIGELILNPIEIANFFNENRLCEHLGCSHYQQIQEAFEKDYYEMDCQL